MALSKHKSRFESEVHLGLMVIIFLLLFLNFVSNYIIFQARSAQKEKTQTHLRQAALSISRQVQQSYPTEPSVAQWAAARKEYGLYDVRLIPSKPADRTRDAKRDWFRKVIRQFPPSQYPELADKLYRAELNELTRGEESEYYYLYPIPAGAGENLLVLSVTRDDLALLDNSRTILFIILLASTLIVAIIYIILSRVIFRPFRRLRQEAIRAGRQVDSADDEIEAIVSEYETAIQQLTEHRVELLRLNAEIQKRADSLEQFNQYLLESGHTGIVTLDPEGQVASINEMAAELMAVEAVACQGADYRNAFGHLPTLRDDLTSALDHHAPPGLQEHVGPNKSLPNQVLGVTISLIKDQRQSEVGLLLFVTDLTEVASLKQELESRRRLSALGEMAGGLAHQIRNSLGAIGGYATLVQKRLSPDDTATRQSAALLTEIRDADVLLTRFLSFARPLDYCPEEVDLDQMIAEILEHARVRSEHANIEFVRKPFDGITIIADQVLLKQALGNILDNAAGSYASGVGRVEVAVEKSDQEVSISIQDYGCGISPERLDQIFTPFYSSRPSGTGLGLPLAAKVVNMHSGHLRVNSEEGQGTCFTISLPLHQKHACLADPDKIAAPV